MLYYFLGTEICHAIRNIWQLYISDSTVAVHLTVERQIESNVYVFNN